MQPRQRRPEPSPRRKPWGRIGILAESPGRGGRTVAIGNFAYPRSFRAGDGGALALPPHASPTLLSLLPELLWLLCQALLPGSGVFGVTRLPFGTISFAKDSRPPEVAIRLIIHSQMTLLRKGRVRRSHEQPKAETSKRMAICRRREHTSQARALGMNEVACRTRARRQGVGSPSLLG